MAETIGRVALTAGNLRNFHIYLRSFEALIPEGGIGGSNATELGTPFTVVFQPGSTIETDVAGDKMILRDRRAVRAFFEATAADVGDVAVIERTGDRTLSVWLEQKGEAIPHGAPVTTAPVRSGISHMRFRLGDQSPSSTSVHGKIRAVVGNNIGVQGDQLIVLLRKVDFSANQSDLPKGGLGSDKWLIGYIRGGLRRRYLEAF
jgi:hypothetical protein